MLVVELCGFWTKVPSHGGGANVTSNRIAGTTSKYCERGTLVDERQKK